MPPLGFEPNDLSMRAAADLRLRPRGYWDRQDFYNNQFKLNRIFYVIIAAVTVSCFYGLIGKRITKTGNKNIKAKQSFNNPNNTTLNKL